MSPQRMSEQTAVYVLFGNTGEYSDHVEWVVRAYTSLEDAEADCAALNEIAKGDGRFGWHERQAVVERLKQHDVSATMDYTGTDYFVAEVPLVSVRQIPPHAPQSAVDGSPTQTGPAHE